MPDTFARFAQELGRIFGVRVVVVRNNSPELIDFNGATLRDGVLYVADNADAPAVTVVMHELLHQMRRDRPDLYATIREEVERQGLIDAYAAKLQGQAEATNTDTGIDREVATEELAADAMGDALSDPDFLVGLARAKPSKFKQLARYILDALDDILAKLGAVKTLRSSEYLTDVSAFRTKLADVLAEYEGDKAFGSPEPVLSRKGRNTANDAFYTGTVPEGSYVHGRANRQDLSTDDVLQLTRDTDVAAQYAGKNGSKWLITPKGSANILDLSDPNGDDMQKVVDAAIQDMDRGSLPFLDDIESAIGRQANEADVADAVRQSFAPDNIVDSAQAYDNDNYKNWLAERFDRPFVRTPDGAVVFSKDEVDAIKASDDGPVFSRKDSGTIEVDGVQRPRTNSNGKPIHDTDEGLRNFWRWFGDSKAVDADGRPSVVYHGTRTKGGAIDAFDLGQAGRQTDDGWMGKGFYFGAKATANVYAGHSEFDPGHIPHGGAVYPVYLSMQNPAMLVDTERNDGPRMMAREVVDLPDSASAAQVRADLLAAGYDGVIYRRFSPYNNGYIEHVVFRPEQIKSATGNAGAFDPADPRIAFSRKTPAAVTPDDVKQTRKDLAAIGGLITDTRNDIIDAAKKNVKIATLHEDRVENIAKALEQPGFEEALKDAVWYESEMGRLATDPNGTQDGRRKALNERDDARADVAGLRGALAEAKRAATRATVLRERIKKAGGTVDATADAEYLAELKTVKAQVTEAYKFAKRVIDLRKAHAKAIVDAEKLAEQKRATVAADTGAQPSITFQYQDRFGDGIKGSLNRLRVQAQDKLLSAMYVQKDIEAVRGAIRDYANVYRRENLMHGRVGDQFETLKRTHTDPLIKAMKAAKINDQLFEDYLEATFAPERNAIIAAKNPAMPDGGSGMTNQQAADFLAGKDVGHRSGVKVTPAQIAAMRTLADKVKALRKETLQRMVDSGEITDTDRKAMEAAAPNYVPLRGKDGEEVTSGRGNGSGIDVRGKMVKEAMGRGAGNRAVNILAEVFGDAERSIVRAEKNRVGKSLARLVLENANKDLWEVEPVQTEQKLDSVGQVYQAVSPNASDQDAIRIMVNGKPFHVKIKYAPLREAMKNLGAEQVPAVLQPLAMVQRYASAILTRYNPAFVQVNMLRDLTQGLVGIAAEKGAKAAKNAAKYYPGAMRAIWRDARGTGSQSQIDRYAREFSEAGGKTFFHKVDNVEQIAGKVGAEFRSFTSLVREGKVGLALNKAVADSTFLQVIEAANDAVENSMRLAAYAALRDSGVSVEKAAEYAKNLTVNFNRKGQSAGVMNSLILFYNAATQGSHRTLNLLSNRKVQLAMGALTTAQMVLAMMAMGADDQDEDGQTAWEKIPEHEKLRNFVFPIVGKDEQGRMKVKMVKWPMPFGFNVFSYAGGKLAELSRSRYPDPAKFASQLIVATIDATMPVKLYEGTDAVSPWLFRVFGAVSGNKDDLGMRIRNENPYSAYEQPKAEMGRADTPEVYKAIAKGLNRIGGGDEVTPPKMAGMLLDRAPEDLEYLAENLTGGIGRLGTQTYGLLEKLATGQGGTISTGEIPFLRTLVTSTDPAKGTQSLFYDRVEKVEREKDRARKALARGGIVEAKKVIAERPELAGAGFKKFKTGAYTNKAGAAQIQAKPGSLVKKLADSRKAVDDINDQIKAAQARTWPSLKSKMDAIRALQDRREKAQREFNVVYAKTVP